MLTSPSAWKKSGATDFNRLCGTAQGEKSEGIGCHSAHNDVLSTARVRPLQR